MFSSRHAHRSDAPAVLNAIDRSLAIIEFDPAGTILTANANFLAVMGYNLAEIAGRHHSIFVAPDYAKSDAYRAFWAKLGRGEFDTQEYRRVGKGGRDVWIQASYNPVCTRRGRVKKIVKIASDVTPARLANADFQGKLAAISRVQAMIEFTPAGEIIMANENFLNALGYRLEEVRGKPHSIFVEAAYGRSRDYQDFWAKLNAGEFIAAEFKRIGKAGNDVWIQASYNPIFDLNGKVGKVVKFATDVTERVRAVDAIGDGLSQLAHNNLEHRLEQAFDPAFEKLRRDYNQSLRGLQATIVRVTETASSISTGTQQIAASSDDMSRRAEQQAASLEETAAALDEITGTVKRSAEGTKLAATAASDAKAGATRSGLVMNEAAAAMGEIAQSSEKITQIIGLIDEIAFQTNLLALNAGVEAARAGETGRGFAVVAQEVRGLAQRSARAAKEIKSLIATSSSGVKRGVRLVSETAESLTVISTKVAEIDALISDIATAAQEQVTGLSHVNSAVNQMDQATQQNAAMIEESTAAAAGLKTEAAGMAELMGQFRVGLVRTPQVGIGSVKLRVLESRRASAATHPAETKHALSVRQAE